VAALGRVVEYEPKDLTITVEAGMGYSDVTLLVSSEGQMLGIDPPAPEVGTIGGVLAGNLSGPRRRLYGTGRDAVIGMRYVTAEGTVAASGGRVVKNVAGLDVQKALIGSLGTLAAITQVSLKLSPLPEATRTFIQGFRRAEAAQEARDELLRSALQPAAIDIVTPMLAEKLGIAKFYSLLVRAGGSKGLLDRYQQSLPDTWSIEGQGELVMWTKVQNFQVVHPFVVRVGHRLSEMAAVLETAPGSAVSRGGNGVTYLSFSEPEAVQAWFAQTAGRGWSRLLEWAPELEKPKFVQWPEEPEGLEVMKALKTVFDPKGILNPGRLYGRI